MRHRFLIFLVTISLSSSGQIYFADEGANIGFSDHCGSVVLGNGLSFADYDGDGYDDITLTSGNGIPLRFYKNFQGVFIEELLISPSITYQTKAINWVDYDNDGDKDLFVTSDVVGNRLFKATPNGLVDVTSVSNLPTANFFTYGASWGDINNDGCLDVYISNRTESTSSITNYLYQSNCDGTFTDVTDSVGLTNAPNLTFCSGFLDINNDGWQDIYVANDKLAPNHLYKNNGNGTFTDISSSSGTDIIVDAMSVTVDDFNNDGYLDIYITNTPNDISTPSEGNVLLRNNGDETFTNISSSAGTLFESYAWGASFLDAENDGDLDLYVSSSFDGSVNNYASAAFFENMGNETFIEPSNIGFVNDTKFSYANAIGDLNNDGKVDIIVMNSNNEPPFVWNNQTTSQNNSLSIQLEGVQSNRDGIGSKIEIAINGNKQYRYIMCGEGYLGQNSFKEVFGLGTATLVDYVKVTWLSGVEDILYNVDVNQTLTIIEGGTLSINDHSLDDNITIFPNPSKSSFHIKASKVITKIEIYNSNGFKIYVKDVHANNYKLNMDAFATGIYFLKVFSGRGVVNKKVLKY